jgi:predicted nucleic acid-binding protein
MTVDTMLQGVSLMCIETAPFIYFVEQNPRYLEVMRMIFQRVTFGQIQVITSTITLTEVLTRPIETGHVIYQQEYRQMLLQTNSIMSVPVMPIIAERAAHLRAIYRLGTPDALHIATAIEMKCHAFLTNDIKLKRVAEMRVLLLDDFTV